VARYPKQAIKNWPVNERPRERLARYGADGLSDAQLVSIVIGTGSAQKGKTALDLARSLLEKFGSLGEIGAAGTAELCEVTGMTEVKALQVKSALELGRRTMAEIIQQPHGKAFSTSNEIYKYFSPFMIDLKKEIFKIILLDSQNAMMRDITVSEGALDRSIVHPREVFKPAIRESAAAIILMHNHPSGDPAPSKNDKSITEKLSATGEVVGIKVLDHIIIGKKGYFSFCDELLL
jgi:DNA repair protein RadC